jgi:hypothetical protein
MFEEVRRRLHLGAPVIEGTETIRVDDVIGTVGRGADFDGCFRPREPNLATRIREIRVRNPTAFNEPIDVIRVDRAYFVADGHKRVSIAKETGVEFIDARVSRAASIYEVAPGVDADSIDRTSREQQFREETGLMAAVPGARFAVSETVGYPELQEALESYAYELSHRLGRLLSREEGAALWYECVYRPTVTAAQEARLPELLSVWTEADLFLALHKQSRQLWGTECKPAQDEAEHLVAKVIDKLHPDPSAIGKLVQRARRRRQPELLPQRQS